MRFLLSNARKEWLKQTRWPPVRQLVQLTRFFRRLKRLGRTEHTVEQLQTRLQALESACANLHRPVHAEICHQVGQLNSANEAVHADLYHQMELLKSSGEVPPEWFEEFRTWKRANPVREKPLVSVCIATFNRSRLLAERCLPSLLRQTYSHLEIIVVGDGCTDDTAEWIAALKDTRIRFENLPQRGRYPEEPMRRWQVAGTTPMNVALSRCTGDFVTHLDDDDEHDPTRVEKLLAFARTDNLDVVWHPFWYEMPDGQWTLHPGESLRLAQVTTSSIFYRSWLARIGWDVNAHLLDEPGDWNRFRKFKYLGVRAARFPEPLLRHYRERSQTMAA